MRRSAAWWCGFAAAEPVGVRVVGGGEGSGSVGSDPGRGAVVNGGWGVQTDAAVAVFVVVVGEELLAEHPGGLDRPEVSRERRAVLEGLERGFAVGVVVAHVWAAVRPGDTEIDEELGDGFGGHRGAPIRVQGQLVRAGALGAEGGVDELFGEFAGLAWCDAPADDLARVDVEDRVQAVADALDPGCRYCGS